jgi:hypothetical protein
MNARATLSNGRTVKENGGRTVSIHFEGEHLTFLGPTVFNVEKIFREGIVNKNKTTTLRSIFFFLLRSLSWSSRDN